MSDGVRLPVHTSDTVAYIATFNRGALRVSVAGKSRKQQCAAPCVTLRITFFFEMADKKGKLVPTGNPFVMTPDSIHFITPIRQTTVLNGILTYDVKRVLELGYEAYTLYYWKDGWQPVKEVTSKDSRTLDLERYLSVFVSCMWKYLYGPYAASFLLEWKAGVS